MFGLDSNDWDMLRLTAVAFSFITVSLVLWIDRSRDE